MNDISALRCWPAAIAALLLAPALPAAAAGSYGECEVTGSPGSAAFTPAIAGQLTVETNLPAPGWWNGDTPETIASGFEYCMAANIAHRLGLETLVVKNVAWDALVAGQTREFDFALSQISITDERKKVVDFSIPYFSSDIGVMVKSGTSLDEASIKGAVIGVQQGTTAATFVAEELHPEQAARVFPDTPSMFTALQAEQIDAAMTDTAIVLGQASTSAGRFEVVGQYRTGETYGALYPKDSQNAATIDATIQAMIDDGTIKQLGSTWLTEAWGLDPTVIPYFQP